MNLAPLGWVAALQDVIPMLSERLPNAAILSALALVAHIVISVAVTCHILLTKENVRSSVGWIGLVILSPFVGWLAYWVFGINRIRRRFTAPVGEPTTYRGFLPFSEPMRVYVNGDEAYPAMLAAIEGAKRSVAMSTYIFDRDAAGMRFVEALATAKGRGVDVRVLADDVGLRYSRGPIDRELRARGVRTARFLPVRLTSFLEYVNLRSHRKLLLVDGETAFIGGMNIRHGHCVGEQPRNPVQDVHFGVCGPVVAPLARIFEEDWEFAAREVITLPRPASVADNALGSARVIADGPDDGEDRLQWVFLSALGAARRRVRIVTPYFLPNEVLVAGIEAAVQKGVAVEVIVPRVSNLFYMNWAMSGVFALFLKRGVEVYRTEPPFDHSKIFLVDDDWCSVGSSNWDDRSIRLNFELNLEVRDAAIAARLHSIVDAKRARGRRLTLGEVESLPVVARLRNSAVRLLSPYL